MAADRDAQVAAVAALAEPTRRRLYDHVARRPDPVSRDEAAAATGVARGTAAFHLDRLVADGLLEVVFERRSGRTGPGAGRPAKLYRRSVATLAVSLPPRRYDLVGDLLAGAFVEAEESGVAPRSALEGRAHRRGRALGEEARAGAGTTGRQAVWRVLEEQGFQPRPDGDGAVLGNCPFHALATDYTDLVCGMNLHLLEGVLDGVSSAGWTARLRPGDGVCCVRLDPAAEDDGGGTGTG
jgi:predicted ArsR family transcriptional regulator